MRNLALLSVLFALLPCAIAQSRPPAPSGQKVRTQTSARRVSPPPKPKGSTKQQIANRNTALGVLNSLFVQSSDFKDQSHKIKVQAQAADLLWRFDEPRARDHFTKAFEAIKSIKANTPDEERRLWATRGQLRIEVIGRISRHDPKWAEELMQSIESEPTSRYPNELQRLMLAQSIAETDPELAVKMVCDDIRSGRLRPTTVHHAISMLRLEDPAQRDQILLQAMYTVSENPTWAGVLALANSVSVRSGSNNQVKEEIIRSYLSMALPVVLESAPRGRQAFATDASGRAFSAGPPVLSNEQILLALYDQYMPEQAPLVRQKLNWVPPPDPLFARGLYPDKAQESIQELVRRAETASNDEGKDMSYRQAALVLAADGDIEGAFSLANRTRDEAFRAATTSWVRSVAFRQVLASGDIDAAYRLATEQPDSWRVDEFVQLIAAILKKKDTERANNLLDEIEAWVSGNTDLGRRPNTWLKLTQAATTIGGSRGLQLLRSAVKAINECEFLPQGQQFSPRKPNTPLAQTVEGLEYKPSFVLLGEFDFSQALALAQSIEKKEASAMAQLAVCEGVLKGQLTSTR